MKENCVQKSSCNWRKMRIEPVTFCQDINKILLEIYGNVSITNKKRQKDQLLFPQHDSQANMSLTHVLFLLLLFVLILKAWHWQINSLSLGFQMSQQRLSSHADVSAGSDVCNLIRAQRERNSGLWPLARLCILSSLLRRDAKLQSLNAARPHGHLSTVAAVLGVHPRDTAQTQSMSLWLYLSFFSLSLFLPLMFWTTCLWLSCQPQPHLFSPPTAQSLSLSLSHLHVFACYKTTDNSGAMLNLKNRYPH